MSRGRRKGSRFVAPAVPKQWAKRREVTVNRGNLAVQMEWIWWRGWRVVRVWRRDDPTRTNLLSRGKGGSDETA